MTIRELIEILEELSGEFGDEVEVRLATQPNYPFEYSISDGKIVELESIDGDGFDCEEAILYLYEGQQLGYLPGEAKEAVGW